MIEPSLYLDNLIRAQKAGKASGMYSICSAHPLVLEASLRHGLEMDSVILLESTCNQVNQYGGYSGMTPVHFMAWVHQMADQLGFPQERLILGGDHLGPLPWRNESAQSAMDKAKTLVQDAVSAGYVKIHLDASMPCAGETSLDVRTIARRTAELAAACEAAQPESTPHLRYVIGTEVPAAGGERTGDVGMRVTQAKDVAETLDETRQAFQDLGVESAWKRVIAVVVQPGVEFGDQVIHAYNRSATQDLTKFIEGVPTIVYEAHSSDYQIALALRQMVEDQFAFLKVGPALTFAYREGILALAEIENILCQGIELSHIHEVLERVMVKTPAHWLGHYGGSVEAQKVARMYSLSDRVRYYWNQPEVQRALGYLFHNLADQTIPLTLISQTLPVQYHKIRQGILPLEPQALLLDKIGEVLEIYHSACQV